MLPGQMSLCQLESVLEESTFKVSSKLAKHAYILLERSHIIINICIARYNNTGNLKTDTLYKKIDGKIFSLFNHQ